MREALVVMIQHGIVFFKDGLDDDREPTYYEIDTYRILMRVRMGRIMRVTEEHYGKAVSLNAFYFNFVVIFTHKF